MKQQISKILDKYICWGHNVYVMQYSYIEHVNIYNVTCVQCVMYVVL